MEHNSAQTEIRLRSAGVAAPAPPAWAATGIGRPRPSSSRGEGGVLCRYSCGWGGEAGHKHSLDVKPHAARRHHGLRVGHVKGRYVADRKAVPAVHVRQRN